MEAPVVKFKKRGAKAAPRKAAPPPPRSDSDDSSGSEAEGEGSHVVKCCFHYMRSEIHWAQAHLHLPSTSNFQHKTKNQAVDSSTPNSITAFTQFHKHYIPKLAVMGVLAMILAACISLVLVFEPTSAAIIPAPDQSHAYKVAVADFLLTNVAQRDPYAPELDRKLAVSIFMPVKKADCTTEREKLYMPADTAHVSDLQFFGSTSSGVFEKLKYKTCCGGSQVIDASKYPIVFLEPHVGTSRFLYSTMARFMSANGVAVVLIDHPYDASIVQYELHGLHKIRNDGTVNLNPFTALTAWNETVTKAIDTRTKDINFVLQELNDVSLLQHQFPFLKFNATLDTSSYTIVGHGLGGTTATTLSILDPRVRFSINLSGSAPLVQHPTSADIYFFGRSDFRRENDINWSATWKYLAGKATEWDLKDAGIFDFSDLPWIVDLARKDEKMTIKDVKGLQDLGPWGFHVTACFLEGYLKAELVVPKDSYALSKCVGMFPQMVPYPGI